MASVMLTPSEWIVIVVLGGIALWAMTHPDDVRDMAIWFLKDTQRAMLEERQRRQYR